MPACLKGRIEGCRCGAPAGDLVLGDPGLVEGRQIKEPDAVAQYAGPAALAVQAGGGKFLARGGRVQPFDAGVNQRTVVVEFPSFEQALATYQGSAYQAAAAKLEAAVERDFRVTEGVE